MDTVDVQAIEQLVLTQASLWGPRLAIALAVLVLFWGLAWLAGRAIRKVCARLSVHDHLAAFLARLTRLGLLLFGIVTALGTIGVDISAIVAGLGLTGFALGFALKDSISNLLAGVLIFLYRPFQLQDRIRIGGFEGEVRSIDLRYTELENAGNRILIPNAKLFTDPITVLAAGADGEGAS